MTKNAPNHAFYHKPDGVPYKFENSYRGMNQAKKEGYKWIDIDNQYCWKSEVSRRLKLRRIAIATHWGTLAGDGFYDPKGKYGPYTRWSDLTLREAKRMRTHDNPSYKIHSMPEMIAYAGRIGLSIEMEVKTGRGFELEQTYKSSFAAAQTHNVDVIVKTLVELGDPIDPYQRLKAAKAAGFKTMLLNHGKAPVLISERRASYIDYVRGKWFKP